MIASNACHRSSYHSVHDYQSVISRQTFAQRRKSVTTGTISTGARAPTAIDHFSEMVEAL